MAFFKKGGRYFLLKQRVDGTRWSRWDIRAFMVAWRLVGFRMRGSEFRMRDTGACGCFHSASLAYALRESLKQER
eukprot:1250989-Pleurochrysis_carterae.AAC.5